LLPKIGNLVHESVVVSCDEDFNEITNEWGECRTGDDIENHPQVLWRIGGYEPERGVAVAGHRGYFLQGVAVMLSQALQVSYDTRD
jgi:seryl-tRNA synthetase